MLEICSDDYMDSPTMSAREKAAVLWAEHVTKNTARTRDDVFEEVRRRFDDREFVELTMVITYFNMRNRFQDALRIPPRRPEDDCGHHGRAQAGPARSQALSRKRGGGVARELPRPRGRHYLVPAREAALKRSERQRDDV